MATSNALEGIVDSGNAYYADGVNPYYQSTNDFGFDDLINERAVSEFLHRE